MNKLTVECLKVIALQTGINYKSLVKSWEEFNDNEDWLPNGSVAHDLEAWVNDLCSLPKPFGVAPQKIQSAFDAWLTL